MTKDFLIPVFSEVYEGNKTDKERFIPFLTKLSELNVSVEEITLVFDKGSNTKDTFAQLDEQEIPYVASLTPTYHEDLLNIPLSHVERVFKHFKNPYHNAVQSQYHWTDHKIRVHTFICVIGLLFSQVLWKKAKSLGYTVSMEKLIDMLSDVRKVKIVTITSLKGKPARKSQLEEMEPELKKLYEDLLNSTI